MQVDSLKHDHQQFLDICRQIETASLYTSNDREINSILNLLKKFTDQLASHLSCEDKYLYPVLINHQHPEISQIATRFKQKMGGLCQATEAYLSKWDPDTAAANTTTFIDELCDLVEAIRTRIRKEEAVLFPLLAKA